MPFLSYKMLLAHVSFPNKLRERRLVFVPDRDKLKTMLKGIRSPAVVEVKSSSTITMDDGENMPILLDFVVIENMTEAARFVRPVEPQEGSIDSQPNIPRADVNKCLCNCSRFSDVNVIYVNEEDPFCYDHVTADAAGAALQNLTLSDNDDHDDDDDDMVHVDDGKCSSNEDALDSCDDDCGGSGDEGAGHRDALNHDVKRRTDDTCYKEVMRLRGSSFHMNYQKAIKSCQQMRANKEPISLRLHFEQVNLRDENAIVIQAFIRDSWQSLGYIPGKKIEKVTQAMESNEITNIMIDRTFRLFISELGQFRLFVIVIIIKKGKWAKDNKNYEYNKLF